MKILFANKYFFYNGGAEAAFFGQADLMLSKGHEICFLSMSDPRNVDRYKNTYFVGNIDYETSNFFYKIKNSFNVFYSFESKKTVEDLLAREKPDLAHLHNIYHQLSPSILHALKSQKIPIVMTLHDYKLICPRYIMLRDKKICEECSDGKYYRCFLNKCYGGSFCKSFVGMGEMYLHHNMMKVYDLIDVFISPSRFLKNKMREMGFNRDIEYVPNFLESVAFHPSEHNGSKVLLYAGRISREKGIFTLIDAVKGIDVELHLIGDGPEREKMVEKIGNEKLANIKYLGFLNKPDLFENIRNCSCVVVPSEWYENSPYAVLEAYELGKPVIASRIGGLEELIIHDKTGFLFTPGNVDELRKLIVNVFGGMGKLASMGTEARKLFEDKFTDERYYDSVMRIYKTIINDKHL